MKHSKLFRKREEEEKMRMAFLAGVMVSGEGKSGN